MPDWVRGRRRGATSTSSYGAASYRQRIAVLVAGIAVVMAVLGVRALVQLIPVPRAVPEAPPSIPVYPTDWDGGPSPALVLAYAGVNYLNGGPADPVIEMKVIILNSGKRHTESTSIRWEPSFGKEYTFLRSEPAPWRVRTDEWGWGVYDGPGVLPEQDGTYLLWFTRTGFQVDEPRIQVIGNGTMFVEDTYAIAMNRILNREPTMQGVFERAPVALIIDRMANALPDATLTAPFGFALGLAGTLTTLVAGGLLASLRSNRATPPAGGSATR